jgi:hypothetical protein
MKHRLAVGVAAVMAGIVLGGCVPAPAKPVEDRPMRRPPPEPETPVEAPPPAPPQIRVSDAERLLYYYEYIAGLPGEQVARELERTQRFFGQHRSDFALMQLVLLKTLPVATAKDRAQALKLKDEARRSEELKQKLEALVETERKMLERKQPTRKE